jgi:hypothetical protein
LLTICGCMVGYPRPDILRAFHHLATDQIIEIEPGGDDTSGHFLHHNLKHGDSACEFGASC